MSEDHSRVRSFATDAVVTAATGAYFLAPILAYADAAAVASFGSPLAVGAGGAWLAARQQWKKQWEYCYLLMAAIGLVGITWQVTLAQFDYSANKERCAHVQREMLTGTPRRLDGSDLFQALGCRPQGTDDVQFPMRAVPDTQPDAPIPSGKKAVS
jgi:hypothetical protein